MLDPTVPPANDATLKSSGFLSNQAFGTVICLIGVLVLTPDSLLVRKLSHLPNFTVIFFRYLLLAATCSLIFLLKERTNSWKTISSAGWIDILAGIVWGAYNFFTTYAFQTTSVGNVLVILAASPMFSALFSYFILHEVIKFRTLLASVVCFAAIFIIFISEVQNSEGGSAAIIGLLCALGASITVSLYFVFLRLAESKYGVEPDCLICNILSGLFVCLLSLGLAQGDFGYVKVMDWLYLVINGVFVLPIAFILLTIGPSYISAPEVSLCTLLETALGPLWVYLGGYERPSYFAIGGGAALLLALSVHSIWAMYEEEKTTHSEASGASIGEELHGTNAMNGKKDDEVASSSIVVVDLEQTAV